MRATGIIQEGDVISWRIEGTGTHEGPFLGIEPTGRASRITGIHQGRVKDGKLIEHWRGPDILAMLVDMGKLPVGQGPASMPPSPRSDNDSKECAPR